MRIIIKKAAPKTPKEPEGERESLRKVTTGTLKWTPMGWEVTGEVSFFWMNLKGIPWRFYRVAGDFVVALNLLTSLEGSPRIVGGGFYAYDNNLTSLDGGPEEVRGNYNVGINRLWDLRGSPNSVGKNFMVYENSLVSIKGVSRKIGGNLELEGNKTLASLEGFPEEVGGDLLLRGTSIPRMVGIPGLRGMIIR